MISASDYMSELKRHNAVHCSQDSCSDRTSSEREDRRALMGPPHALLTPIGIHVKHHVLALTRSLGTLVVFLKDLGLTD